jgi:hypothetical protein
MSTNDQPETSASMQSGRRAISLVEWLEECLHGIWLYAGPAIMDHELEFHPTRICFVDGTYNEADMARFSDIDTVAHHLREYLTHSPRIPK